MLRCEAETQPHSSDAAVYLRVYPSKRSATAMHSIMSDLLGWLGPQTKLCIPKPLASDRDQNILLLDSLPGRKLKSLVRSAHRARSTRTDRRSLSHTSRLQISQGAALDRCRSSGKSAPGYPHNRAVPPGTKGANRRNRSRPTRAGAPRSGLRVRFCSRRFPLRSGPDQPDKRSAFSILTRLTPVPSWPMSVTSWRTSATSTLKADRPKTVASRTPSWRHTPELHKSHWLLRLFRGGPL